MFAWAVRALSPFPFSPRAASSQRTARRASLVGGVVTIVLGGSAALCAAPADAQSLGAISGTVTDAGTGAPLYGICVSAEPGSNDTPPAPGAVEATATTSTNGTYVITGLVSGAYTVAFSSTADAIAGAGSGCGSNAANYATQWYPAAGGPNDASTVYVTAGATTSPIGAAMTPGGSISGTVTYGPDGSSLSGICVSAGVSNGYYTYTDTGAGGTYSLTGLPAGSYGLGFTAAAPGESDSAAPESCPSNGGDYAAQWWEGAATAATSTPVPVSSGEAVSGIDPALVEGGSITGTVVDASTGEGVPGVSVSAIPTGPGLYGGFTKPIYWSTTTGQGGAYSLTDLDPSLTYYVEFTDGAYLNQWFDDQPNTGPFPPPSAEPVAVTAGDTTPSVDAALVPSADVLGTYYVNGATGGSPSCGAAAGAGLPFSTIQAALDCAATDGTTPTSLVVIDIAAGTYDENDTVDADVDLAGAGAASTVVDGTGSGTVMTVEPSYTVGVFGLTLENGTGVGGLYDDMATVTATDDSLVDNSGSAGGGLTDYFGTVSAIGDTFSGNSTTTAGGGLYDNGGTVTATGDTFAANSGSGGGGIFIQGGTLTATDDTLWDNTATGYGGGIEVGYGGTVTATSDTLAGNSAAPGDGGGVAIFETTGGTVNLADTVLDANSGGNCGSTVVDDGDNVSYPSTDTSCPATFLDGDPGLGPLAENGGPAETMAIGPASAAFEAVGAASCTTSEDARGDPRPGVPDESCDAGAFEYEAPTITSPPGATFTVGESNTDIITSTTGDGGTPTLLEGSSQGGPLPSGIGFANDGDGTATLAGTPALGTVGTYPMTITARDGNGISVIQDFTLTIEKAPQVIAFSSTPPANATAGGPPYTVTTTGGGSGNPVTLSSGTPSVCTVSASTVTFVGLGVCVIDANQAGSASYLAAPIASQSFAVGEGTSTTALELSTGTVTYGHEQVDRLSVTVSAESAGATPTGSVTIAEATRVLCRITLAAAKGSCSLSPVDLAPGTYTLVARYGGSSTFGPSSSPSARLTVQRATSTTGLTLSAKRVTYGDEQTEHLTVTVSPQFAGSVPTGTVTVTQSATTLCKIKLSSSTGSCTLSAKRLRAGVYHLVATYAGSAEFESSASHERKLTVVT